MIIISVNDQYLSDQSPANLNDDTNGTVWTVKSLGDQFCCDLSSACLRNASTVIFIQWW